MVCVQGNPDGSSERGLHGQPGHRLPVGDRSAQPRRCRSTTCCRPGTPSPGMLAATGLLAAERHRARTGRGPAGQGRALRRRVLDGRQPRQDRRGAGQRPRAREGRQLPLRRLRPRLLRPGRAAGHGRRADAQAVAGAWSPRPACARQFDTIAKMLGVSTSTSRAAGSPRARSSVRSCKPWLQCAHPRRDLRALLRRQRRLVGPVPDLPAAGRGGPALLDRQPDVRRGRAARDRHLPDAGLAAASSAPPSACPPAARPDPRRAHRRGPRRACSGSATAEIGRLHDGGVVAGPGVDRPGGDRAAR